MVANLPGDAPPPGKGLVVEGRGVAREDDGPLQAKEGFEQPAVPSLVELDPVARRRVLSGARQVRRVDVVQGVRPVVPTHHADGVRALDDDVSEPGPDLPDAVRVGEPVARRDAPGVARVGPEPGSGRRLAGVACPAHVVAHQQPPGALDRPVPLDRLAGQAELGGAERRQGAEHPELPAERRVAGDAVQVGELGIEVVEHLDLGPRLPKQHRGRAVEGLDVDAVRGQVGDDPGGHHGLAAVPADQGANGSRSGHHAFSVP